MAGGGGEDSFIQPLGLLLGLTALVALLLSYLGQSTIVAFILVGVVASLAGANPDPTTLGHISEVGILILLFMAGLEVDLGAFLKNWRTAAIIGVGQILCSTSFFAAAALLVLPAIGQEVNVNSCVYFGLCLCFSSTILVLGYLKSTKSMGTLYGQLCLGTLVLQDAASVLGIAVLGGLNQGGGGTCVQSQKVDCQAAQAAGEDVYNVEASASASASASACDALGAGCGMAEELKLDSTALFARMLGEEESTETTSASQYGCVDACAAMAALEPSDLAAACSSLGSACVFTAEEGSSIAVSILVLFGKLLLAMLVCFLLERFVLDRMFSAFARSLELLYLGALGYATGMAAIAVTAGFSGEITAFLAGVSLSRLPYKMHIETKMEPIKSLGVAVFFLSLGLQLELGQEMVDALPIGFGLAFFTLFATLPLFAALGVPAGLKSHTVFMLGLLMNQISEFSLILCTLCVRAKVFEPVVLTVMTVAAVISIIVSSMGHAKIDAIYRKMQRWTCLRCLDERRARKLLNGKQKPSKDGNQPELAVAATQSTETDLPPPSPLHRRKPSKLGMDEDWAFEDQLPLRTTEHLEIDLKEIEKELELARESMSATADEKLLQGADDANDDASKMQLYTPSKRLSILTSHAPDIMQGMIEGYVVVDHELVFCTLRAGRMLFWRDQQDVGHAPPASVWDVSGMAILKRGSGAGNDTDAWRHIEDDSTHGYNYSQEDLHNPWEWTIVLGHIHRHKGTASIEDDAMKLAIHGLEDQSDHDAQDWDDALSVATSTLNPIALRLAHIREELHSRRSNKKGGGGTDEKPLPPMTGFESRMASNSHRNEIICIGYNEMFPAVLALADAIGKEVVVVEYDPMKLNTIEKLYSEEKRRSDFREKNKKKGGKGPPMATVQEIKSTDVVDGEKDIEMGSADLSVPRRIQSGGNLQILGAKQETRTQRLESVGTASTSSMMSSLEATPTSKLSKAPQRSQSGENLARLGRVQSGGNLTQLGRVQSGGDLVQLGSKSPKRKKPRRVRMMSSPTAGFWGMSHSRSEDSSDGDNSGEEKIHGVKCEYADIHDPECWEELEMDQAFMLVCTIKGARHAEKAMLEWLRRQESDAIFVACSTNNVDAMRMYKAGAHFVMQTDALAMRSTREIFLETVANFGDCSQLVAAGLAHKKRLVKLQSDNSLKFQYETG